MSTQLEMSSPMVTLQPIFASDPILKYLANGGSWAISIEMDYTLNLIPKWAEQYKAALKKHSPSAKAHQQRLLNKLKDAYAFCGIVGEAFEAKIRELQA